MKFRRLGLDETEIPARMVAQMDVPINDSRMESVWMLRWKRSKDRGTKQECPSDVERKKHNKTRRPNRRLTDL
jgi:hypothetical protein